MVQASNHKILRGFSRSAGQYDQFSSLHREIADKLLDRLLNEPAPSVLLDVGCGTGYLTGMLKKRFPQTQIIGLDFAQGMLEEARSKHEGITWVLADGHHLPFSENHFDRVVSNLAYQWSGDLVQAFAEARRVLLADGMLACTLFGYHTCRELFQSLDEAGSKPMQFTRLPDKITIREALEAGGFKNIKVNSDQMMIEFKDMHELLTWLRSIGANNLSREGFLGRGAMAKAAAIYRQKFPYLQGIGTTFEVIQIYAKK